MNEEKTQTEVTKVNWGLYTTILGGVLVLVGIIGLATGKKGN